MLSVLKKLFGDEITLSVFEFMLKHADDLISVDDISSKFNIKKNDARKVLEKLVSIGVVEKRGEGYILSMEHEVVRWLKNEEAVHHFSREKISKLTEMLKKARKCDILLHHNADPDAVGSGVALAIGLKQLGVECRVVAPLGLSAQSKKLLQAYPYPIEEDASQLSEMVIVVDTGSSAQLPAQALNNKKVVVIDHHTPGDVAKSALISFVDEKCRATAVVIYYLLLGMNVKITREIATYLIAGIVADTGFLRMCRNEEVHVLDALLKKGVDLQHIMNVLHVERDYSERIAVLKGVRRVELYSVGEVIVAITEIGSYESMVALSLLKLGADVGVAANIQKDEIRISCRVRSSVAQQINMLEIFSQLENLLNGKSGGHITAVSFNGKAPENWDKAREQIVKAISEKLGKKVKKI